MALSQAALQATLRSQTEIIFLECLDIVTPSETIRLVNDTQNLDTPRGQYQKFPFETNTTAVGDNNAPKLTITADGVDQRLIGNLREVVRSKSDLFVVYRVTTKQNPGHDEYPPTRFTLDTVSTNGYTKVTLSCLYFTGALNDTYPTMSVSPASAGDS